MNDDSDSELISAYLDGELTAEEQVRAEQILASSAEARQLLEELRALGGTLQSLPQEKLDENLGARVLEIAERRMLSPEEPKKSDGAKTSDGTDEPSAGRAAATLTSRPDDSPASEGFPWRELSWRGMLSPRALIWSAIVIVVAIVIHFNSPPQNPNRQIAREDKAEPAAAAGDKAVEMAHDERRKLKKSEGWETPAGAAGKSSGTELAKSNEHSEAVAKSEIAAPREKAPETGILRDQSKASRSELDDLTMKSESRVPAKDESRGVRLAGESSAADAKAGPAAPSTPIPPEKPTEPAFAFGAKMPARKGAAQSEEQEPQKRFVQQEGVQQEGVHSKSAVEPNWADRAKEPEDAAEIARGGLGMGGGGQANEKKLSEENKLAVEKPGAEKKDGDTKETVRKEGPSQIVAANSQLAIQAPANQAAAPIAAPAAAPAPMAPMVPPPLVAQKGNVADAPPSNLPAGQAVPVVQLTCSPVAAQNKLFDKLLAQNGLAARNDYNNSRQSLARNNFNADNSGLNGMQTPIGGTASLGSTAQQQQYAQQVSPEANQARREAAMNTASRGASQALNTQQAATLGRPRGTGTIDNSSGNSLNGSNYYGNTTLNGNATLSGTQSAMTDNSANAYNANGYNMAQQAGVANQNYSFRQGPAQSANVSNLGGVMYNSMSPSVTYEVDASPAQLAALLEQIGRNREAFSSPDVPPSLKKALKEASRRTVGAGGFAAYKAQAGTQAGKDVALGAAPSGPKSQEAPTKQGHGDAEQVDQYREQAPKTSAGAIAGGALQPQSAAAPQVPAATATTHVFFVLTVVDRAAAPPPVPAPAAPSSGK
jgi:hypothetical protein